MIQYKSNLRNQSNQPSHLGQLPMPHTQIKNQPVLRQRPDPPNKIPGQREPRRLILNIATHTHNQRPSTKRGKQLPTLRRILHRYMRHDAE